MGEIKISDKKKQNLQLKMDCLKQKGSFEAKVRLSIALHSRSRPMEITVNAFHLFLADTIVFLRNK